MWMRSAYCVAYQIFIPLERFSSFGYKSPDDDMVSDKVPGQTLFTCWTAYLW